MRLVPAFALAITALACSAPEAPPGPVVGDPNEPVSASEAADDVESRGTQAGLSPAQSAQIAGYGFGAVVPQLPEGWRLASYRDETVAEVVTYPAYYLQYAHDDGRCFELMAASEGLGDVFVIEPPSMADVDVPQIALFGLVPIGWSGSDEAGDWGPNRLSTEWFGTDALSLKLGSASEDACTMVTPETARELLASLRYLDPADDSAPAGHWEFVDAYPAGSMPSAVDDPAAHALMAFASEGEEGTTSSVRVLRAGPHIQVVLVTSEGLADDSVRDQRTRVAYLPAMDGGWIPQVAGRQQRCQQGRGHQDWSPEPCV